MTKEGQMVKESMWTLVLHRSAQATQSFLELL